MPISRKTTQETPIFYMKQNQVEETIQKSDDSSTEYIIMQNNNIHNKYLETVKENVVLTHTNEEIERDNDVLQKAKTCLQGHVKNEYYRAENYKLINEFQSKTLTCILKLFYTCNIICLLYMIIPFINCDNLIKITTIFAVIIVHLIYLYEGLKRFNMNINNKKVIELLKEIKEIESSNKYLEELVDNF
jgi:hypothetical protein